MKRVMIPLNRFHKMLWIETSSSQTRRQSIYTKLNYAMTTTEH